MIPIFHYFASVIPILISVSVNSRTLCYCLEHALEPLGLHEILYTTDSHLRSSLAGTVSGTMAAHNRKHMGHSMDSEAGTVLALEHELS